MRATGNGLEPYYDIIKFILEKSLIPDINFGYPRKGWTMLHHAITLRDHKVVQYLVERGADPNTWCALPDAARKWDLESVRILVNNGGNLAQPYPTSGKTVIDELRRGIDDLVLEDFFTDLFDAQLESKYSNAVVPNYGILAPEAEPRQMAVVSALIRAMPPQGLYRILKHPLLQLYIIKQWSRFSKVLYSFLVLYTIFVSLLSWYTIHLVNNNTDPHVWLTVSMLVFAIILFLQNLLQFFAEPKWFIMQAETWLSFVSPTLSIAIAINGLHTSNTLTSWVLYVLSLVLPLSWIRMLQFFAHLVFPSWGHYALLLYIVLKNVLKVLSIGLFVIFGFSLSFSILFHNNEQFDGPWKAFAKTIVMMTGEFEYGDLFSTSDTGNSKDRDSIYDDLPAVTGRIVFVIFVIITSIVLMNLMTALAVIDVQALVSEGELERSRKRAMFIAHWEQAVLKYSKILPNIIPKCCLRRTRSEKIGSEVGKTFRPIILSCSRPSKISMEVWRAILTIHEKNRPDRSRSQGKEFYEKQGTYATIQALLEGMESLKQQLIQDRNADVQQAVPDAESS